MKLSWGKLLMAACTTDFLKNFVEYFFGSTCNSKQLARLCFGLYLFMNINGEYLCSLVQSKIARKFPQNQKSDSVNR